eukprot:Plantae.Rhodophyta-Hildenbrandia_rubra.ctg65024.p2 GENE.Plantae.Rhodophyta-Hildenbrandia_rubra.ctg65024~~Plantae.Rhodophyta-Hildenbrandia_rubra.ctg65024.p2  ORF type:complete len:133 (-),score=12.06 Plantae.Rhodophyta-Hildenbrandia_rubra.ctg65024:414-812(-)
MQVRSLPAKRNLITDIPSGSRRKASAADRRRAQNQPATVIDVQQGFGNEFETEALPNALPRSRNNPLRCPYNLYAEQISGTPFITERSKYSSSNLFYFFFSKLLQKNTKTTNIISIIIKTFQKTNNEHGCTE